METIQTDQDVDQLVWSIIADSRNPHDFVAYCRHAVDRDAGHDRVYDAIRTVGRGRQFDSSVQVTCNLSLFKN